MCQTLFVDVKDCVTMYCEAEGYFICNTTYIHTVDTIIRSMLVFGVSAKDILLITFYTAQRHSMSDCSKLKVYLFEML